MKRVVMSIVCGCDACPFRRFKDNDIDECSLTNKPMEDYEIPLWCPLPPLEP